MKQSLRKILALSLLLLFASYYAGATLFIHSHSIDGEQIVHSHPIFGGEGSSHSHSKAEINLIANLTSFALVVVAAIALSQVYVEMLGVFATPVVVADDLYKGHRAQLRAPPVIVVAA